MIGSSDNTYKIALDFQKQYPNKIFLLRNYKNMGLNYTLNKCAKMARGKFLARQDGDDISLSNRLQKQIDFLNKNPDYTIVTSSMITFDENGDWGIIKNSEKPTKYDFIKNSPINHAPCIIRKEAFEDVEGYTVDRSLLRVEDYHLWFKLYSKGYKAYSFQEPLYKMRDDKNAQKRRNFKNRINEMRVKKIGFKMINIPWRYNIYILRPIFLALTPPGLYKILHYKKLHHNR